MMQIDLGTISTILAILAIIFSGGVWVISIATRQTSRIVSTEKDIEDLEKRATELEQKTSYDNLEKITKKIMVQVFHSKDFRNTLKETVESVLTHNEKNRTDGQMGALNLILEEFNHLKERISNSEKK